MKQKLASAVRAGIGQWADTAKSPLGRPIYQVTDGPVTVVLSELGFAYCGPTPAIERRYDEVADIDLGPLTELMMARGDLSKLMTIRVILHGSPTPLEMQWPLRIYSNVATVLLRIVTELA